MKRTKRGMNMYKKSERNDVARDLLDYAETSIKAAQELGEAIEEMDRMLMRAKEEKERQQRQDGIATVISVLLFLALLLGLCVH